jgi:hypothetical protein
MEFVIQDWVVSLYIANTIDLYLHVWVPSAIAVLALARKFYKYKKDEVKIQPVLGVAYKPGSRKLDV